MRSGVSGVLVLNIQMWRDAYGEGRLTYEEIGLEYFFQTPPQRH